MGLLKKIVLLVFLSLLGFQAVAQVELVEVKQDDNGFRLMVDNEPFEVKGVVWGPAPIGENYSFDLWGRSDDYIRNVLDTDAELMTDIGVNAIRPFGLVPQKWVEYLYYQHGIYTIVYYDFGRYGVSVNGKWHGRTDYSDKDTREHIKETALDIVRDYRKTAGVLMFLFGNENNYGLEWEGAAVENLPMGQQGEVKAGYLYSLYEEVLGKAGRLDHNHPMGIVNGDIQYLNIIEALVPSLDILGVNTYRGSRASDMFYKSIANVNLPVIFTEFGADAYNAKTQTEDQYHQAVYIKDQWEEIYNQSYGKGKSQNCLGGFVFEWMDEWWKDGMYKDLDDHSTGASWLNGGYGFDAYPGINNMNEEWFGLVGQSEVKFNGLNRRLPRAAYYLLKDTWALSMYSSTPEEVKYHFDNVVDPLKHVALGESHATKNAQKSQFVTIDGLQLDVVGSESFDTLDMDAFEEDDKSKWNALDENDSEKLSLTLGINPMENLTGNVVMKFTGNTYDPIFATKEAVTDTFSHDYVDSDDELIDDYKILDAYDMAIAEDHDLPEHVELYSASFEFDGKNFDLNGYYHEGLADWYLEGDYFNLKPEAFDFVGMDNDGSKAPFGLLFTGNKALDGFKIFVGPEIYSGARPQVLAKYNRGFHTGKVWYGFSTMVRQYLATEDDDATADPSLSGSVSGYAYLGPFFKFDFGGYYAGDEKEGESYSFTQGGDTYDDVIDIKDAVAVKVDFSTDIFSYANVYGRYVNAGAVADTHGFVPRGGFFKADSGSGNREEINAGIKFYYGDFIFDIVGRKIDPIYGVMTGAPRNRLTDAFYVHSNRSTIEGEAVLTFDMTGDTYFHDWDALDKENALFAGSLSALYIYSAGETDRTSTKSAAGDDMPFTTGLPEESNLWLGRVKIITNPTPLLKIALDIVIGHEQCLGGDSRVVDHKSASLNIKYDKIFLKSSASLDAWGPQSWHREQNITFPLQWNVDLGYSFDNNKFTESTSRIGIFCQAEERGENSGDVQSGTQYEVGVYASLSY